MYVVCATRYEVVEERRWRVPESPLVHLFVDARGVPARCAAVLFIDGDCPYTDGMPSASIMQTFTQRADNQIMTLEILAISVGLSTFAEELKGRKVIVYSDNTGAEVNVALSICFLNPLVFVVSLQAASRKGRASSWDHCGLIHEIWSFCLINQTYLWIERVPSASNISDVPSREDINCCRTWIRQPSGGRAVSSVPPSFSICFKCSGVWRQPTVATHYFDPLSELALRD